MTPKFVSPSDPAAQWTGALKSAAFFAYADNYLIDVKFGIIMDVEATRAIRQAEVGAAKTMIDRTEERFDIKPERLAADTAYGSARNLNWLVNDKADRSAYSRYRQIQARGRDPLARGFHFLQGGQRLHLPGVQPSHHDRQDHERRRAALQSQQTQLQLRCVLLQDAMLSKGAGAQDFVQHL